MEYTKYLTDLHYNVTNKSTINKFTELYAHPRYKKQIEPVLKKFIEENKIEENILLLSGENKKNLINKLNQLTFINIPEYYLENNNDNIFFNNADCLSLKEDLFLFLKDFGEKEITKRAYKKNNKSDYVINHHTLSAEIGLFNYNKQTQQLELQLENAKLLSENDLYEIKSPQIRITELSKSLKIALQKTKKQSLKI